MSRISGLSLQFVHQCLLGYTESAGNNRNVCPCKFLCFFVGLVFHVSVKTNIKVLKPLLLKYCYEYFIKCGNILKVMICGVIKVDVIHSVTI